MGKGKNKKSQEQAAAAYVKANMGALEGYNPENSSKKKAALEDAQAWYGSPEYQDYLQAQARATGGGITGFNPAVMNAPQQIRKDYLKQQEAKKVGAAQQPQQQQAPASTAPPAATNNPVLEALRARIGNGTPPPAPNLQLPASPQPMLQPLTMPQPGGLPQQALNMPQMQPLTMPKPPGVV